MQLRPLFQKTATWYDTVTIYNTLQFVPFFNSLKLMSMSMDYNA